MQKALCKVLKGVGGLSHEGWRSFSNERKTCEARNFIVSPHTTCSES